MPTTRRTAVAVTAGIGAAAIAGLAIALLIGDDTPSRPVVPVSADRPAPFDRTSDATITTCERGDNRQPAARAQIINSGPGLAAYIAVIVYTDKNNPAKTYGDATQQVNTLAPGEKATAIFTPGSRMPEGTEPGCILAAIQRRPIR